MSRRNGCSKPFHPLQVASWVLFTLFAVVFGVVFLAYFHEAPEGWVPLAAAYALCGVVTAISAYIATVTNPSDLKLMKRAQAPSPSFEAPLAADEAFCYHCEQRVHRTSRHCPQCDKCVEDYDHHCLWLNNCIGSLNYREFFVTLASTTLLLLIQLSLGIFLIVKFFTDEDDTMERVRDQLPDISRSLYIVIVIVVTCLVLFTLGPLAQLFGFHIMLKHKGLTTYDFLVQKTQREAERHNPPARPQTQTAPPPPSFADASAQSSAAPRAV